MLPSMCVVVNCAEGEVRTQLVAGGGRGCGRGCGDNDIEQNTYAALDFLWWHLMRAYVSPSVANNIVSLELASQLLPLHNA